MIFKYIVVASIAKQSKAARECFGLLRYARNDGILEYGVAA